MGRLSGLRWGASATIFRAAAFVSLHSTAEYCTAVWCRTALTCFIVKPIDDALRIMTGCLPPTPMDKLFFLVGTQPTELRRQKALLAASGSSHPGVRKYTPQKTCVPIFRETAATHIDTPICACSARTAESSCPVRHHCRTMGGLEIEPGMTEKYFRTPFIHCIRMCITIGNVLSQTCMSQT